MSWNRRRHAIDVRLQADQPRKITRFAGCTEPLVGPRRESRDPLDEPPEARAERTKDVADMVARIA